MMQRSDIENREAADVAAELKSVFDKLCGKSAAQSLQRYSDPLSPDGRTLQDC